MYRVEDKVKLETAKLPYLTNLGNKVNDHNTSQNAYQ